LFNKSKFSRYDEPILGCITTNYPSTAMIQKKVMRKTV